MELQHYRETVIDIETTFLNILTNLKKSLCIIKFYNFYL